MLSQRGGGGGCGGGGGGGGAILKMGSRCQECGNQAKKECPYMRCRTCCKSKGFQCPTHVKSTWVPVYRRRHSHSHSHHQHHLQLPRAPDHHNPTTSRPPPQPRHVITNPSPPSPSQGLEGEEGKLPAEVNSVATFRCFRVRSVEEAVDQHAYQASVVIGGRLFKGILYDQGPDDEENHEQRAGQSSSSNIVLLNRQNSNFNNNAAAAAAAANTGSTSASAAADILHQHLPPSYPSIHRYPFNAFMPGTPFFLHPK